MDGCVNNIPITFLKKHGDKNQSTDTTGGSIVSECSCENGAEHFVSFNPFPVI